MRGVFTRHLLKHRVGSLILARALCTGVVSVSSLSLSRGSVAQFIFPVVSALSVQTWQVLLICPSGHGFYPLSSSFYY